MRYLLTNDDGIYAKGLSVLYEELSKDADCLIVAPEVEHETTTTKASIVIIPISRLISSFPPSYMLS